MVALVLVGCGQEAAAPSTAVEPPTTSTPSTASAPIPPLNPSGTPPGADLPAPGGVPVLTLVDHGSFWCPAAFGTPPLLVVYDNGVALRTEHEGSYCEPVPRVWVGPVDVDAVRARMDAYLAAPESAVDLMVDIPTDTTTSTMTYLDRTGATHAVEIHGRGIDRTDPATEELISGRLAYTRVWNDLMTAVPTQVEYQVTELLIAVSPGPAWEHPERLDPLPVWPLHGPPWDSVTVTGCVEVSGPDAAAVLTAYGSLQSLQTWDVGGTPVALAVELLLPGTRTGCPA